jgi:hypothetical protein
VRRRRQLRDTVAFPLTTRGDALMTDDLYLPSAEKLILRNEALLSEAATARTNARHSVALARTMGLEARQICSRSEAMRDRLRGRAGQS